MSGLWAVERVHSEGTTILYTSQEEDDCKRWCKGVTRNMHEEYKIVPYIAKQVSDGFSSALISTEKTLETLRTLAEFVVDARSDYERIAAIALLSDWLKATA